MEKPNKFDAGNPSDVKKSKTKAQLQKEREREELRQILSTVGGRAFVWRTLEKCGVYRTSFTGNSTTFFNEGKRSIGLELIEDVFAADIHAYTRMRQEAVERTEGHTNG